MLQRKLLRPCAILALILTTLPLTPAPAASRLQQDENRRLRSMHISSYDDDPFVADSVVERLAPARYYTSDGLVWLWDNVVGIATAPFIYRKNTQTGDFIAFANNPWPLQAVNVDSEFTFPNETRFPVHEIERDAAGKPVLDANGLQIWKPRELYRGMTTVFEAAHAVKKAGELWAGRDLSWGENGQLIINAHAFLGSYGFYNHFLGSAFFGVLPYHLPGESRSAPLKMFETATSWEMAAHVVAHALHAALKPNRDLTYENFQTWVYSFADQMAMWASLRDEERVQQILTETNGNLHQSNALSRYGEAFGVLRGTNVPLRDAFHTQKVSDTFDDTLLRSTVLTGAAYSIFATIYDELQSRYSAAEAMRQTGRIMGIFLTRATDYLPENRATLDDAIKAYFKVDKEFFASHYHTVLVDEFLRRELCDTDTVQAWLAHEAALPPLRLPQGQTEQEITTWLQDNLEMLGIEPDFGLQLQSLIHDRQGRTIVRVQLIWKRDTGDILLDNHGILTFRATGALSDYHSPLPPLGSASEHRATWRAHAAHVRSLLVQAMALRLHQHAAPLAVVRQPNGQVTVEARVIQGHGLHTSLDVFSLDYPEGERREVELSPRPPQQHQWIADDLLQ